MYKCLCPRQSVNILEFLDCLRIHNFLLCLPKLLQEAIFLAQSIPGKVMAAQMSRHTYTSVDTVAFGSVCHQYLVKDSNGSHLAPYHLVGHYVAVNSFFFTIVEFT